MKVLNFWLDDQPRLGLQLPGGVLDVSAIAPDLPRSTDELIALGQAGLERLAALAAQDHPLLAESEIRYAPAVLRPQIILCVGLNYAEHVKEGGRWELPGQPVWFNKLPGALIGHRQPVRLCRAASQHDAEAEIVVVIGKEGRYIDRERAHEHIFGYTLGNDISARDLQNRSSQWFIGKACDTFGPLGPVIATRDSVDEKALDIRGYINGELRQSSDISHMIFDIAAQIADASQFFTLRPGDLIFTGTCAGVIMGRKPPLTQDWLKAGDKVAVASAQIGELINPIIAG